MPRDMGVNQERVVWKSREFLRTAWSRMWIAAKRPSKRRNEEESFGIGLVNLVRKGYERGEEIELGHGGDWRKHDSWMWARMG